MNQIAQRVLPIAFTMLVLFLCLPRSARADDESDRAALRLIRTNYMAAINTGDLSKIAQHLSKDVTGVMVTGEAVAGFEGLQAYWKKIQDLIGPGGSYHVTVNVDKTDLSGDFAVSHGATEDIVRLGNGKELRFNSFWTAVCRKEAGVWKVLRMEATMDPVNNVFVSLQVRKGELTYGVGGLILGAVVVLAFVRLRHR